MTLKTEKLSVWDLIKVNWLGQIPKKPEVREYLNQCAEERAKQKIIHLHVEKVK